VWAKVWALRLAMALEWKLLSAQAWEQAQQSRSE
jgi:hypothetical protein